MSNVRIVNTNGQNEYLRILEAAWQAHILPREENAPTVISTFAGCGGSSLGYSMAGFRELLAVEWNDNAVETFRLNFPDVPVYHGDITKLSIEQCLEMAGIQTDELDVLDGSPPCQGFSTAGKRILADPRNQMFREYVRLLRGLRPKVFIMENVSGMVKGKMKLIFAEILAELKACGYRVKAWLLNAMYFNVPQSRLRVIFIGIRNDLRGELSCAKAQAIPFTAHQAIPSLLATRSQRVNPWINSLKSAATICTTEGYQAIFMPHEISESEIRESWQMSRVLRGIEKSKHFGLIGHDPDKPSPAIMQDVGGMTTGLCHPIEIRRLTISEIKRLASFPDDFSFIGNYRDKWTRIGNSVPPLFMQAIASHIRTTLLDHQSS